MRAPVSQQQQQQKQRISLNLPPEIQQWLLTRARQDGRPLAEVAAAVLEEALQQQSWEEAGAAAMQTPAADSPAMAAH